MPAATPVQLWLYGAVVSLTSSVPPLKNSTVVTVRPAATVGVALSAIVAGAVAVVGVAVSVTVSGAAAQDDPFQTEPPGHTVVSSSVKVATPPSPLAVQIHVEGAATQPSWAIALAEPVTVATVPLPIKPFPVDVQVHDTALALVVFQVEVKFCPATIGEGVRVTAIVGAGDLLCVFAAAKG